MKKFRLLGLLLIAGVLFSCEKDIEKNKDNAKQEVVFGIEHVDPLMLKAGHDDFDIPCPEDATPVTAHIKIEGITQPFTPDVFIAGGKLYTQAIMLDADSESTRTYKVEEFLLKNADGITIMATPMAGSDYAEYVEQTVSFDFEVNAFEKTEVYVEVLCYMEADYEAFGFTWFNIGRIVVNEMCFFGDFCIKDASDYANSLYANQSGFPTEGYVDAAAIFEIRVTSDNGFEKTFSNAEWNGVGEPLCVNYPNNLDRVETFTLELHILVRVGDNFEYVYFHTWTLEDDEQIPTDEFGVVDFVLGSCAYNPHPNTLILPPYHNLPERALVEIYAAPDGQQYEKNGAYFELTVNALYPAGSYDFPPANDGRTYLGWCGDAFTPIPNGEYTFFVYSSLNDLSWPAIGLPLELYEIARVNWLFNNLSTFGYPSLQDMFVHTGNFDMTEKQGRDLQHAIWMLLGSDPSDADWPDLDQGGGPVSAEAIQMYNAGNDKDNFIPLPGGYAAVLMVVEENGIPVFEKYQLVFTMVDP